MSEDSPKKSTCSLCGQTGHNKRTCLQKQEDNTPQKVVIKESTNSVAAPSTPKHSNGDQPNNSKNSPKPPAQASSSTQKITASPSKGTASPSKGAVAKETASPSNGSGSKGKTPTPIPQGTTKSGPSVTSPTTTNEDPPKKDYKCSLCGDTSHNKRKCPQNQDGVNPSTKTDSKNNLSKPATPKASTNDVSVNPKNSPNAKNSAAKVTSTESKPEVKKTSEPQSPAANAPKKRNYIKCENCGKFGHFKVTCPKLVPIPVLGEPAGKVSTPNPAKPAKTSSPNVTAEKPAKTQSPSKPNNATKNSNGATKNGGKDEQQNYYAHESTERYRKFLVKQGISLERDQHIHHIIAHANGGADHRDNYHVLGAGDRLNIQLGNDHDSILCYWVGKLAAERAVKASIAQCHYSGPSAEVLYRKGEDVWRRLRRLDRIQRSLESEQETSRELATRPKAKRKGQNKEELTIVLTAEEINLEQELKKIEK